MQNTQNKKAHRFDGGPRRPPVLHTFKKDVLKNANVKDKTLSHYDIMRNPNTKELFLVPKGNNSVISTGTILR